MPRTFYTHGFVASESLITALLNNNGAWAHAVLGQGFHVPDHYKEALLKGEAEWQTPNKTTLIITLAESQ